MSVTEQRYKAVQGVLADGRTVSEVASQWSVSRRTVHRWLAQKTVTRVHHRAAPSDPRKAEA